MAILVSGSMITAGLIYVARQGSAPSSTTADTGGPGNGDDVRARLDEARDLHAAGRTAQAAGALEAYLLKLESQGDVAGASRVHAELDRLRRELERREEPDEGPTEAAEVERAGATPKPVPSSAPRVQPPVPSPQPTAEPEPAPSWEPEPVPGGQAAGSRPARAALGAAVAALDNREGAAPIRVALTALESLGADLPETHAARGLLAFVERDFETAATELEAGVQTRLEVAKALLRAHYFLGDYDWVRERLDTYGLDSDARRNLSLLVDGAYGYPRLGGALWNQDSWSSLTEAMSSTACEITSSSTRPNSTRSTPRLECSSSSKTLSNTSTAQQCTWTRHASCGATR